MADNEKPTAPAAPAQNQNEANARRENGRRSRDQRSDALKRLEDENEARHKANLEAEERRNNSRPTPTQQENDLAKLGHPVDEKEDDGSGPEEPIDGRRGATYNTRDLTK